MSKKYDSTADTIDHITTVRARLREIVDDLEERASGHDQSKLHSPEKEYFDEWTPKLNRMEYGSDEYTAAREAMKPGLDHHYAANDHHPEHGDGTLRWMSMMQIIELLCDWKASTERMKDGGDLMQSILINAERFDYGQEMTNLLVNTVLQLDWL